MSEIDHDTMTAILDNLDTCGIQFDGCFLDHDGNAHEPHRIEDALSNLDAKTNRLRQLLAWAKTMPAAE